MPESKRTPDYVVARTVVIVPPAKSEKVPHVEAQVLVPIRPEYSNLGRNEGSLPGGKRDREASPMISWNIIAAQKLQEETGIIVPAHELHHVGKLWNRVVDTSGETWTTLSHVFMALLKEHPELVCFDQNQTGMLWLNIINGQLRTDFQNERGETTMEVTLAFNTRKMIEAALRLRNSLRENN